MIALLLLALAQGSPEEEAVKRLAADLPGLAKGADADGNGALNPAEFRTFAAAMEKAGKAHLAAIDPSIPKKKAEKDLQKHDANKDGKLDAAEMNAMAEAKRLKDIKDFDWDGDGKLSEKEQTAMGWAAEGASLGLFRKVDTNGDGALSNDELGAAIPAVSDIKIKKAKP